MKAAWACSIVAQIALAVALWRCGDRGWWLWYLCYDLLRSGLLWPMAGHAYWLAWVLTEPPSMFLQVLAVEPVTRTPLRPWGLLLGLGGACWSIALTNIDWPTARRASLLMRQCCVYGCAGALLSVGLAGQLQPWLTAYFGLHVLRSVAEQFARARSTVDLISTISLFAVAVLFGAWGIKRGHQYA